MSRVVARWAMGVFEVACALTSHWNGCWMLNHNPFYKWLVNQAYPMELQ